LNVAPVLLHNPLNSVEAESRAFPDSLGCEERLEDMRQYIRRNSRAAVFDFNHNAIVVGICTNPEFALASHGVNGVINEVGPYLIQLAAK